MLVNIYWRAPFLEYVKRGHRNSGGKVQTIIERKKMVLLATPQTSFLETIVIYPTVGIFHISTRKLREDIHNANTGFVFRLLWFQPVCTCQYINTLNIRTYIIYHDVDNNWWRDNFTAYGCTPLKHFVGFKLGDNARIMVWFYKLF